MTQHALLDQLEIQVRDLLEQARTEFAAAPSDALVRRADAKNWNALECFAHLNVYFDYYFPLIEKATHKAKARRWAPGNEANSNLLGRLAIRAVDPANLGRKGKKTPKPFNFLGQNIPPSTVKAFIINAEMLLRHIRAAREVDLNKAKVKPIRWRFWYKFRLGDLLQYLTLHAQRHLNQARRAKGL